MRETRPQTTVSTSIDPDLATRTSWVDAYTAYVQIARVCTLFRLLNCLLLLFRCRIAWYFAECC